MTRQELKALAKTQIKGNIGILFVLTLVVGIICGIPLAGLILGPGLSLSLVMVYLGLTEGKKPCLEDLVGGLKLLARAWCLSLMVGVFTFLWGLLLWIPGIIKAISYSMSFFVLADDPELTASQALNISKEITKGHKMEIFVLGLSFIGWMLLGTITLGIGLIYVIPYMETTMANFYQSIKPAKIEAEPMDEAPILE